MIPIDYNGRCFRVMANSGAGALDNRTVFEYKQEQEVLSCVYKGTEVALGHLLGKVSPDGRITMVYHQIHTDGQICTGKCISVPEVLSDGRIRLHESWEWNSGKEGKGTSILEELTEINEDEIS